MLTKVSISGFKAIKEANDVSLGRFALFIGRNGSGKSSFLEALQWLQEVLVDGVSIATAERFGSFEDLLNRRSKGIWFELWFGSGPKLVDYQLWLERGIVTWEQCQEGPTEGAKTTITTRKGKKGPAVRTIAGANPVRSGDRLALAQVTETDARGAERLYHFFHEAVFLRLSPTAMARKDSLLVRGRGALLAEDGRNLAALLGSMKPVQRRRIAERVAEVIDGVEAIEVVEQGTTGYFQAMERMRTSGGTRVHGIPAWLLSEGMRRITAIFALLETTPHPSLIAIEEIENGLDPWTLLTVLRALREASADGVQVLLTTHSPFLLDHVEPDEVIHVRRSKGDTAYIQADKYEEVKRYMGVVPTGAMYTGGYLEKTR